jgi:hypothetical protein
VIYWLEKRQKYIEDVEKDRAYNLETLDSSLLKYSAAGIGLFSCIYGCMYDKFCSSFLNMCFVLGISFLLASMLCQLFSFKVAAISQDYYLLFWEKTDTQEKLKAFHRLKIFRYINAFLNWSVFCSFTLACISLVVMFWMGLW